MVGDEDVRAGAQKPVEAADLDVHARRRENQARPRPRAPVREASAVLEEAGPNRERPEYDGVHGDGGNEKKDGPPPVERRNSEIQNAKCKMQTLRSFDTTRSKASRLSTHRIELTGVCIVHFEFCITRPPSF